MIRAITSSALCLGFGILLTACGASSTISLDPSASAYRTIRISSGVSSETKIVSYLYAAALQQAGYDIEIVDTGSSRADYMQLLENQPGQTTTSIEGTLDIVPDYAGELLMYLTDDGAFSVAYLEQEAAAQSATPSPSNSDSATPTPTDTALNVTSLNSNDIHSSIQRILPEGLGLLDASAADPKHALYVTLVTAEKYQLESLEDLQTYCASLTFDMPQNYENSSYLGTALEKTYQCRPETTQTNSEQSQRAENLITATVQIADLRATSPAIETDNLLGLRDPANIFISQNITPVIRSSEIPESAQKAINMVSGKLTNADVTKLIKLTSGNNSVTYEDAAKFWLKHLEE